MTPWIEISEGKCTLPGAQRSALEPLIEDVLFEYMAGQCALEDGDLTAPMQLTFSKAMEVLQARQARWLDRVSEVISPLGLAADPLSRKSAALMADVLAEAHGYFRRNSPETWRAATQCEDANKRFLLLWSDFFAARLMDWLQKNQMIADHEELELADTLVECAKLWIRQLSDGITSETLATKILPDTSPECTLTFKRGPLVLRVRGRPQVAIQFPNELVQYSLAGHETAHLELMKGVLNAALTAVPPESAVTVVFVRTRIVDKAAPDAGGVAEHFKGFAGNGAAVRKLKSKASAAKIGSATSLKNALLLLGGGGSGKSELLRRLASALDVPCVEFSGAFVRRPADLIAAIRKALAPADGVLAPGTPFVLGLEHVQHWHRCAAEFLPLFDDRRRHLVADDDVCDLSAATVVVMAHSRSQVPESFVSRLQLIELEPYRAAEVGQIVIQYMKAHDAVLADDAGLLLARMARCVPGRALDYARDLLERHSSAPKLVPLTTATVRALAPKLWRVDESGLTHLDYLYLRALEAGPRGLPALQQLLPISVDEISVDVEPFLRESGAIKLTPKGRALTATGEQLIHRHRSSLEDASMENEAAH